MKILNSQEEGSKSSAHSIGDFAAAVLVIAFADPRVIGAIRTAFATPEAAPAAWPKSKKGFASHLGKSGATIDRLVRMGMPFAWVGASKTFGEDAVAWLAKERRSAPKTEDMIDVSSVVRKQGLRVAGGSK